MRFMGNCLRYSLQNNNYTICLFGIIGFPGSGIQCRISHNLSKSAKIGSNTARLGVHKTLDNRLIIKRFYFVECNIGVTF